MSSEHYHNCPECHRTFPCSLDCSIVSDLEDPIGQPGRIFGTNIIYDNCEKVDYYNSKEFKEKYTGLKPWPY